MTKTSAPAMADSNDHLRNFWLLALALLALRVISLWFNNSELFFDEAQYWAWAKQPDFGYYSKPPLLSWIIAAFTGICGDSEFCVRLPSPIFHTATAFVLFLAGRCLFDSKVALVAGGTWLLLPAVTLSSTLISTDVPLLFCWTLALYAFLRLECNSETKWALLLGLAIGLGLNAKYAMGFFIGCGLILAVLDRERRQLLTNPKWWLAVLISLAMLAPNIIWNYRHQFATVQHTGDNMNWGGFPHFDRLAEFVGSQFGVAGPILFAIYLIALFRLSREGVTRQQKLLIAFSLPVFVVICLQAIMSKAFANWAATAMPALVLLVSDLLVNRMPAFWNRVSTSIHAVVFVVLAVAVAFATPGQLPMPNAMNPFQRIWGGKALAEQLTPFVETGKYAFVLADNRKNASTLIYYLRDTPVDIISWRNQDVPMDHFEMTRALQDLPPADLENTIILYPTLKSKVPTDIAQAFGMQELLGEGAEYPGSRKTYRIYALGNYHKSAQ